MKEYTIDQLFATQWPELNQEQFIKLLKLSQALLNFKKDSLEYGLIMIEALKTLRKKKRVVANLSEDQALDCFNDITFFQRTADGNLKSPWLFFPIADFYVRIGIKKNKFSRPEINGTLPMYNRSFSQLCFADAAFSAFCLFNHKLTNEGEVLTDQAKKQLTQDIDESLSLLIAVLYTEPDQFDEKDIDSRARLVARKLNLEQKSLILHTYANVRAFITSRETSLFKKSETQTQDAAPQFTGEMWMNLRFDLAKTDVFKGFSAASNARIYDALDFLDKEAREAEKRKQPE